MASSVHGSYDVYNNGTSYFNGSVTVDDVVDVTGTNKAIQMNGVTRINGVGDIIGTSYYVVQMLLLTPVETLQQVL